MNNHSQSPTCFMICHVQLWLCKTEMHVIPAVNVTRRWNASASVINIPHVLYELAIYRTTWQSWSPSVLHLLLSSVWQGLSCACWHLVAKCQRIRAGKLPNLWWPRWDTIVILIYMYVCEGYDKRGQAYPLLFWRTATNNSQIGSLGWVTM